MALFGVDGGPARGLPAGVCAAPRRWSRSVHELSRSLADDLDEPLRIGIGIHTGPAVVGQMGYASRVYLTAVGDTVHVAARLEALTKDYACELVISEEVAVRAGLDVVGPRASRAHGAQPRGAAGHLRGAERGAPCRAAGARVPA